MKIRNYVTALVLCGVILISSGCGGGGGGGCAIDLDCSAGEFCEFTDLTCGASGSGSCTPIASNCGSDASAPVCTCDGITFSNACSAQASGQSTVHAGTC